MWSDESRYTLFWSDDRIVVWQEAEVIRSSYLQYPPVGAALIWGCCSYSGSALATSWAKRLRSADKLNMLKDRVIAVMDFYLHWCHGHVSWWQYQDSGWVTFFGQAVGVTIQDKPRQTPTVCPHDAIIKFNDLLHFREILDLLGSGETWEKQASR